MRKLIALEPEVYEALKGGTKAVSSPTSNHMSVEKKVLSALDTQMHEILNSDKLDSEKIVLYNQALQKSNLIRRKSRPNRTKEPKVTDSTILSKFRKKAAAKKLLNRVKNQKNLNWDHEGTLLLDKREIPGSNIHKLFQSSLKKREPTLPGWNEFNSIFWEKL